MTPDVLGAVVDSHTRCTHFHTERDVVAIKFACCQHWYPCHRCHEESERHAMRPWPADQLGEFAILCGVCRKTMTITDYLQVDGCSNCAAAFNPGCASHWSIYFDVPDLSSHCQNG